MGEHSYFTMTTERKNPRFSIKRSDIDSSSTLTHWVTMVKVSHFSEFQLSWD